MGTTLAIVGLVGGVVALFAIEVLASGDKSALYRAVLFGVAVISLIALAVSLFFSGDGINRLGTVLAVVGLIACGLFYTYGSAKPIAPTPPSADEEN